MNLNCFLVPASLASVPLLVAPAIAAPMDNSQGSIGSRGDGEVIVINDCRPGSVRWNIDGEVHCVAPPCHLIRAPLGPRPKIPTAASAAAVGGPRRPAPLPRAAAAPAGPIAKSA
jgi:hypothetical protein